MSPPQADKAGLHILLKLAALVIILAGIHAAADILVQLLLALFFAIVLNPLVTWLIRRGVRRPFAITLVVTAMLFSGIYECLLVGALFLVVHMVLGNMVEPRMMGHRLGMSTLVVFLSLLVWGWLLGPVGMLLSVPLTSVCKIWMETTVGGSKLAILLGPGRPKSRLPG
ncbi:AI-2E family transporter [Klebsiella pneumoniae]|uniref:AI-2E family transporter n=1 Tax=Klebsiella pneumoniae TaxID=573 RepID=UPI001B365A9E|nr:AI-2E family transporter [Klebsiella pneumoniae]MBQ0174475.1 AI-2E family transporter [Klebsiella pneumoniae]